MPSGFAGNNLNSNALGLLKRRKGMPGFNDSPADRPHEMNRYMGGHRRINQPYVSGYWYCIIEPPHRLFDFHDGDGYNAEHKGAGDDDIINHGTQHDMEGRASRLKSTIIDNDDEDTNTITPFETTRWLHSTAESFTPPTRSLTVVDVPGMGAQGSSYVAGQQLTREFSIAFREYQNTPILNIMNTWTSGIDQHYGASPFGGAQFIPANYKGTAWVFLCKPSVSHKSNEQHNDWHQGAIGTNDVEEFFFFEGVMPNAVPHDSFASDIATNDVLQLNITFTFDGWPYTREYQATFEEGMRRLNAIYAQNFEGTYLQHMREDFAPEVYNFPFKSRFDHRITQSGFSSGIMARPYESMPSKGGPSTGQ